jgi:hypothetical protein
MTLHSTARSMAKIAPPEPVRWDLHLSWDQKVLEGAIPPMPAGCGCRNPPRWVWPQVEARLGYGVGQRVARYFMVNISSRRKAFAPPPFWQVLTAEVGFHERDHFDQPTAWVWRPAQVYKGEGGGYRVAEGQALRLDVRIDGVTPGLDEGAAYAMEAARRR